MAATLKSEASPEIVAFVKEAESRCDNWAQHLSLTSFPHDVAVWGALTQIVDLIEQQIQRFGHGSIQQREAMMNLGRAGAQLLGALRTMRLPEQGGWLRWTSELRQATMQAIFAAHNCENFAGCFIAWHQNRMAVEIIPPSRLRFSAPRSSMDRRIRAHQQGRRVPGWPSTPDNPIDKAFIDGTEVAQLIGKLCQRVTLEGALAIAYPDDSELLSFLRDISYRKLETAFRRDPALDLGGYNLGEFRRFFAALQSICSVHEYVCFYWATTSKRYPFESAVMTKPVSEWVDLLARLGNVDADKIRLMLLDLTLGATRPLDIYIHPFIPNYGSSSLFLVPHFIMNSRPEENVLRVCSYARPRYYQPIANAKEEEMRDDIKKFCPDRYSVFGPIKLPEPLPDIDIIIKDSAAAQLLIAELKWLRKPTRVIDQTERAAELDDGFRQLRAIRDFLVQSPRYLKDRGVVDGPGEMKLSFAVIARDYLNYSARADGLWLGEFDALRWSVANSSGMTACISLLQSFEWLPVEGRDFRVQFDSSVLEGITMESEVFYATG